VPATAAVSADTERSRAVEMLGRSLRRVVLWLLPIIPFGAAIRVRGIDYQIDDTAFEITLWGEPARRIEFADIADVGVVGRPSPLPMFWPWQAERWGNNPSAKAVLITTRQGRRFFVTPRSPDAFLADVSRAMRGS